MSSWVLEGLRRLLELAQEDKCSSSAGRLGLIKELEDGAIRKTSSVSLYLMKKLPGIIVWRKILDDTYTGCFLKFRK